MRLVNKKAANILAYKVPTESYGTLTNISFRSGL